MTIKFTVDELACFLKITWFFIQRKFGKNSENINLSDCLIHTVLLFIKYFFTRNTVLAIASYHLIVQEEVMTIDFVNLPKNCIFNICRLLDNMTILRMREVNILKFM